MRFDSEPRDALEARDLQRPRRAASEEIAGPVTLRRCPSVDDYVASPFGRYVCGPTFVAYWASAHFNGLTFWGRPDEEHMKVVTRALDAVLVPDRPSHSVLVDASRLSGVDVRAFAILAGYMLRHRATHARLCTRQALLRPNGLPGAVVAGFYALIDPGYPVKVFDEAAAAFAWLDLPEAISPWQDIDRIRIHSADDSALFLSEVRALLDQDLEQRFLPAAASALAVSERTLQRRLLDAGSSFRAEVAAAQVRLAQDLLQQGDRNLKTIAARVGYGSPARFTAFFHRATGKSPAVWAAEQVRSRQLGTDSVDRAERTPGRRARGSGGSSV
jgi:AraC-like DNA-binding protein